jgi:Fe-S cluster assembly protein SufB
MSTVLHNLVNQPYKHGFVTAIESDVAPKGLNEDTIRLISIKKNEPQWLLAFRLEAYRHWLLME